VPRQTRTARARRRAARTDLPSLAGAPAVPAVPAPPVSGEAPVRAAPVAAARPAATPVSRGLVTDYGYIISELKRIFILSVGIIVLLIVLWLIFG
jgi:hypothetical protein